MPQQPQTRISNKTIAVVDNGLFLSAARVLGESFGKVYYITADQSAFPNPNVGRIGVGYPEIEVCNDLFDVIDKVDMLAYLDVNRGPEQAFFRKLGVPVWGAGLSEDLELDRKLFKNMLAERRLPLGAYDVVKGITALRAFLKRHRDWFIKISYWRGLLETLRSEDYALIEPRLDKLEYQLGPAKEEQEFICEQSLPPQVELAIDAPSIDGVRPAHVLQGIELKGTAYLGWFTEYENTLAGLRAVDTAFAPWLKSKQCRSMMSIETRIGKDKRPFAIDPCMRCGSPPGALVPRFYKNFARALWEGAAGNVVDLEGMGKYGVEIIISCDAAEKEPVPVRVPSDLDKYVALRSSYQKRDLQYTLPQNIGVNHVGGVIGWGNTVKEAFEHAKAVCEEVKGAGLDAHVDEWPNLMDEVKRAQEYGLKVV
jgi:hypothetical protein